MLHAGQGLQVSSPKSVDPNCYFNLKKKPIQFPPVSVEVTSTMEWTGSMPWLAATFRLSKFTVDYLHSLLITNSVI